MKGLLFLLFIFITLWALKDVIKAVFSEKDNVKGELGDVVNSQSSDGNEKSKNKGFSNIKKKSFGDLKVKEAVSLFYKNVIDIFMRKTNIVIGSIKFRINSVLGMVMFIVWVSAVSGSTSLLESLLLTGFFIAGFVIFGTKKTESGT